MDRFLIGVKWFGLACEVVSFVGSTGASALRFGGWAFLWFASGSGGRALVRVTLREMVASVGSAAGRAFTRVGRSFFDPRSWRVISEEYWAIRGPAMGRSLHHWLIPQRWRFVPSGIRNAGFNLVELPSLWGVFHPSLSLNSWMGFAPRWGGTQRFFALAVENGIRGGIPLSLFSSACGGYIIGDVLWGAEDR
ncbi:MAG TPA: hypothetical protein EYP14_07015 [Planctomycetaceae bacterium]|nr:hypothetical protein [Planctomycetaceae bacterium]